MMTRSRWCSFSGRARTWAKAGRARRPCSPSCRPRLSAACTTSSIAIAPASGPRLGNGGTSGHGWCRSSCASARSRARARSRRLWSAGWRCSACGARTRGSCHCRSRRSPTKIHSKTTSPGAPSPSQASPTRDGSAATSHAIAEAAGHAAASDERKTRFLLRLLARLGEPAIVFTEFRDTLARLAAARDGRRTRGLGPTRRDDGGRAQPRAAHVQPQRRHAARHRRRVGRPEPAPALPGIVHYELPWNSSRLEQRAGRVDRLGQTRRVHELALVAAHTAERLVVAPLITRFAATTTARGRMLDALTESRVAAAVMTHAEPAGVVTDRLAALPSSLSPGHRPAGNRGAGSRPAWNSAGRWLGAQASRPKP